MVPVPLARVRTEVCAEIRTHTHISASVPLVSQALDAKSVSSLFSILVRKELLKIWHISLTVKERVEQLDKTNFLWCVHFPLTTNYINCINEYLYNL